MAITFNEIAKIVGVSRATVDRVIHNRGNVKPEVAQRIRDVAKEYGFEPNHIGKALARAKNPVKIGVAVHMSKIPFFQRVLQGVEIAREELIKRGGEVIVFEQEEFDPKAQIDVLEKFLDEGVHGVAITPAHDKNLRHHLNRLIHEKNVPVVTLNTDIESVDRLSYVGVDNIRLGRVGAYLMDLLIRNQQGKVLLISGYSKHRANRERIEGFIDECEKNHLNIELIGPEMSADCEEGAYDITKKTIEKHPDISGIFMVSSGQPGCCRALIESGRAGDIKLIVVDSLPETNRYLCEGVIDFIVDQNAIDQGYKPPIMLFDYIFAGIIPQKNTFCDIGIKTLLTV